MNKEQMIKELVAQGMHRIEAQSHIASHDLKAQQAYEECNCRWC